MTDHDHGPACQHCGTPMTDANELDIRITWPDAVLQLPEAQRADLPERRNILNIPGTGTFVRCLLPVRLTGDFNLVFGTWIRVDPAEHERIKEAWNGPDYASLWLSGELANAIKPWHSSILHAPIDVAVHDPKEIPYITASSNDELDRILHEVQDRDEVLMCIADPHQRRGPPRVLPHGNDGKQDAI